MSRKLLWIGGAAAALLLLAACTTPTPVVQTVEVTREVEVTRVAEATPAAAAAPAVEVPFETLWAGSPHADASAVPFTHWNADSPAEIPVTCAKCHSTPGYLDYIGADGSAANAVDKAAPIGTVIVCVACHNDVTLKMTSVLFPSGVEVTGLGREARCMQCHQGRASKTSVDDSITKAGLKDDDTVGADLGFTNIHYFAAGATLEGTITKGGYEYDGKKYDAHLSHVAGYNTCIGCHNPHTLQIRVDECVACHTNVKTVEDLKNVRMNGSKVDYNGNGNVDEGIYYELDGLRGLLLQAMQAYAKEVSKTQIAYTPDAYPYFFIDANGDGKADADEAKAENGYNAWTGRLAKAAYNYQTSIKDPGAFAHGGKYIIELVYDSIESLNEQISTPIDLSKAHRVDAGHFAGSEEAFRHWDAEGEVPGSCARCHTPGGLPTYLKNGVNIAVPPANGLQCSTCHDDVSKFTRFKVDQVKFPSGATVTFGEGNDANLCINCHQGRESTVSVNGLIKGLDLDKGSEKLRFLNIHYFAAGATLFGTDVKGAYEFDGKTYVGRNKHVQGMDTCIACHDVHGLTVQVDKCGACHNVVKSEEDVTKIRMSTVDYDGDGNVTEGLAEEVSTMREALYAAMQAYATDKAGAGMVYTPDAYPYFFTDTNGNGQADKDEVNADNGYKAWTPRLLQSAYNYQFATKDPGTFAHNGKYILQVLYDSIANLDPQGVKGMTRP